MTKIELEGYKLLKTEEIKFEIKIEKKIEGESDTSS